VLGTSGSDGRDENLFQVMLDLVGICQDLSRLPPQSGRGLTNFRHPTHYFELAEMEGASTAGA
jgi:hypothetical protein